MEGFEWIQNTNKNERDSIGTEGEKKKGKRRRKEKGGKEKSGKETNTATRLLQPDHRNWIGTLRVRVTFTVLLASESGLMWEKVGENARKRERIRVRKKEFERENRMVWISSGSCNFPSYFSLSVIPFISSSFSLFLSFFLLLPFDHIDIEYVFEVHGKSQRRENEKENELSRSPLSSPSLSLR